MRFLLAGVAAAAAAAVVAVAAAAPLAQAEESARVVSVAVGSGKVSELVEAPADGTPFAPSWSRDGGHFAYSNTPCDGCAPEIRLVALGSRRARGPGGVVGNGSSPALSGDGRSIVFVDLAGGLSVVTPSARRTRTILPPVQSTILDSPHFSPDGRKIVFLARGQGERATIERIGRDGSGVRALTPEGAYASPAWSPDGRRIAFARRQPSGRWRIGVMSSDGRDVRMLDTGTASDSYPTWSPDGRHIAFTRELPAGQVLCVSDADGRHVRPLTPARLNAVQPAWSPRGGEIAFISLGGES